MINKIVSRDTPLAEITIRKYEKPSADVPKRDLVKKLCLSVGLLQPGDSRDIVVDILHVLSNSTGPLDSEELQRRVIDERKEHKLALNGIAQSNIRRQLRRLRELFLIEKIANTYRVTENESLHRIYEEKLKKFYIPMIMERVEDYFKILNDKK
jgi:DNA-binding transcriptional ArsR family regulator